MALPARDSTACTLQSPTAPPGRRRAAWPGHPGMLAQRGWMLPAQGEGSSGDPTSWASGPCGGKSHPFHRKKQAFAGCCLWFCFSLRTDTSNALGRWAANAKQPERTHYGSARGLWLCEIQKTHILGIFTAWQVLLILFWGCQLSTRTQYTELRQ